MEDIPQSIEDAWAHCLGESLPTAEEIAGQPMEIIRVYFFAGALYGLKAAYRYGFTNLAKELNAWADDGPLIK